MWDFPQIISPGFRSEVKSFFQKHFPHLSPEVLSKAPENNPTPHFAIFLLSTAVPPRSVIPGRHLTLLARSYTLRSGSKQDPFYPS